MSDQSYSAQLPFAQLDLDRLQRRGVGEIVFGEGKTAEEIAMIMMKLIEAQGCALTTRVSAQSALEVKQIWAEVEEAPSMQYLRYVEDARCLTWRVNAPKAVGRGEIGVVTAGTSDGYVASEAEQVLRFLGHSVTRINDIGVAGLHRLLVRLDELRQAEVLIVCAGMEGALPSVIAGLVDCPVIGVPTSVGYGANLGGVTALLGMINSCAAGVVVVNIDNGFGAAYAAAQINRVKPKK
jgi:pyridinium-3,5-biscarboxylic acid mononucleotide synthase